MCELLAGLPEVNVVAVEDRADGAIVVHVESRRDQWWCPVCEVRARVKQLPVVELFDVPRFGRPARLAWRKHRLVCGEASCPMGSWTHTDERITAPKTMMTARAARWATAQVGRRGRAVSDIAAELGCDWPP